MRNHWGSGLVGCLLLTAGDEGEDIMEGQKIGGVSSGVDKLQQQQPQQHRTLVQVTF